MFLSRNKKNNVYPCQPQFYYIKVGFKGVKIIYVCSRDVCKWNILKLVWSKICIFLNVGHSDNGNVPIRDNQTL